MEITYIRAVFNALRKTRTIPLYRYDHDIVVQLIGVSDLPEHFQAHFANSEGGESISMMGQNAQVAIPNELLETGLSVYCWVYVENEITGRTVYTAVIPVHQKSRPSGEVTPEQADIINQAINALNTAGDSASQSASSALTYAERAEIAAESAEASETNVSQSATISQQSAESASQSATDASESEARARRYAQDAEVDANRAEMAAHEAGYFDVEIDARDHLIYTRTDEVDADFAIDTRGHLVMEVGE